MNAKQPPVTPVRDLRDWLTRLTDTGRLAVIRDNVSLKHELAAIAKVLDDIVNHTVGRVLDLFSIPHTSLVKRWEGISKFSDQ